MMLLLLACAGGKDDSAATSDVWGWIVADRDGESAAVQEGSAWGFDSPTNGKAVLYLAANAELTCAEVATALDGPEDPDWDRSALLPPETCAVFAYFDHDPATGSTWTEADGVSATVSVSCAMDPGTWEPSDDCLGSSCYTGHYWQGSPTTSTLSVTGGDGDDYGVDLAMDGYTGQFTYETLDPAPATGAVSGATRATWCPDLGQTSWFSP